MKVRSIANRTRVQIISFVCFVLMSSLAFAQPSPRQPPADPNARADQRPQTGAAQEGFVPVDQLPKPEDRVPAPALVGTAYAFVWVAFFGYMWSIRRRLSTVDRELQALSRRLEMGNRSS